MDYESQFIIYNEKFDTIIKNQNEQAKRHNELMERLFLDNGDTCLQSKVNRNTSLLTWVLAIGGPIALAVVAFLVNHLIA